MNILRRTGIWGVLFSFLLGTFPAKGEDQVEGTDHKDIIEKVDAIEDPFEDVNRVFFSFNENLNDFVLFPLTDVYTLLAPPICRTGVGNVLQNLVAPVKILNYLFQGEGDQAGETFGRFLINTLLGLGGIFDVATELGIPASDTNFGQTLETWGVSPGPYLVLPIIGPTSGRDALGIAVDYGISPWNIWCFLQNKDNLLWARYGLDLLQTAERYKKHWQNLQKTSLDFYAVARSLYTQKWVSNPVHSDQDQGPSPL